MLTTSEIEQFRNLDSWGLERSENIGVFRTFEISKNWRIEKIRELINVRVKTIESCMNWRGSGASTAGAPAKRRDLSLIGPREREMNWRAD